MSAMTRRASGCQRPPAPQLPFWCKRDSAAASSRGAGQRFPHWCNKTEDRKDDREDVTTEPTTASSPDPFAGEDCFCQGRNVLVFPLKKWPLWSPFPPKHFGGRGPWPPM